MILPQKRTPAATKRERPVIGNTSEIALELILSDHLTACGCTASGFQMLIIVAASVKLAKQLVHRTASVRAYCPTTTLVLP